jgi:hypothetical protein
MGRQSSSSAWCGSRSGMGPTGNNHLNKYVGDATMSKGSSVPNGYRPPYCWELAMNPVYGGSSTTVGDLSVYFGLDGEGSLGNPNLAAGMALIASLSGEGAVSNATGSLIVSIAITILGSGGLTASLAGKLDAIVSMAGSGDITGAIGAISGMTVTMEGIGEIDGSTLLTAIGYMVATIYVNQSEATVNELVDGVWEALAADHNNSGTMGQKLNGAGSAGDPWGTDLTAYTTEGTAGKKLKDGLTTGKFIALK